MPRAFIWPSARSPEPLAARPAEAPIPDAAGLAAAIGPELTRLFGARCAAHLLADPGRKAAPLSHVAAVLRCTAAQAAAAPSTLTLLLAPEGIARLTDILFGAPPGPAAHALPALPPGSASWMTLARFLADAMARALAATGQRCLGPATIPARAAPQTAGGEPQLLLRLDLDGIEAMIGVRLEEVETETPVADAAPDPELWRRRARNRALDLALPVALRLAETRVPLAQVAALSPGDILPLDRPASIELLAGGRRLQMLPASSLIPAHSHPDNPRNDEEERK